MFRPLLLVPVLAALLTGCSEPAPAPIERALASASPLTSQILATIIQDRLSAGDLAYDGRVPRAVSGAVHYRATATAAAWTVTVGLGRSPGWLARRACRPAPGDAPAECFRSGDVRVAWHADGREVLLVSARGSRFVTVRVSGVQEAGDPRSGHGPVELDQLVALAGDPRIDATTDARLALRASNLPNWREDLECAKARRAGVVNLPRSAAGGDRAGPTPQAFAAVLASQVNAKCVGEWSGTGDEVGALAYLGSGTEWVAAYVTADPAAGRCPSGWEDCRDTDGDLLTYRFQRPREYPAKVRLVRRIEGGFLVVEQASQKATPDTREFPVPLLVMRRLVADDRLAMTSTTGLIAAGNNLPLCWRIAPRVDAPPEAEPAVPGR